MPLTIKVLYKNTFTSSSHRRGKCVTPVYLDTTHSVHVTEAGNEICQSSLVIWRATHWDDEINKEVAEKREGVGNNK